MKIGITCFVNEYYALVKYINEHGKEKVALRKVQADENGAFIRHDGGRSRLPRGVRPSLEGKQRMPLSSQVATQISWSPLSGLKGVRPPLQFGERTRDCPLGKEGKEGSHLARTGASQGFPRAAAPVGVFSRGKTRISGNLSCGAREVRSLCAWRGGARPGSRVTGGD